MDRLIPAEARTDFVNLHELQEHLSRIDRSLLRASIRTGDGHEHTSVQPDGRTLTFRFNGVPQMEEVEDHVRHTLIDLWSLRDYVIHSLKGAGRDESVVWKRVKARRYLALAADLANLAKHGKLLKNKVHWICPTHFGKSTYSAQLRRDPVTGHLLGSGVSRLIRGVDRVEIDVINQHDPSLFSYELPVLDPDEERVDEACNVLAKAAEEWRILLSELDIPWPERLR